jgi:hypothetical protein
VSVAVAVAPGRVEARIEDLDRRGDRCRGSSAACVEAARSVIGDVTSSRLLKK